MEKVYKPKTCIRCQKAYTPTATTQCVCVKCRSEYHKEKDRERKRRDKASTMTRNGRGAFTLVKRAYYNGGLAWDEALPDHSRDVRRSEIHTSSDILHATPEKSIAILNRILSGRDTYVG